MRWGMVILLVAIAGCKPHVTLVPPPPNATPDQRVRAFNDLHAVSEKTTTTTSCRSTGGCSTTVEKTLYLGNGTQVHHADDLLPVLPPDSESAREVEAAHRARTRQKLWTLGAVGVLASSFVVFAKTDNGDLTFAFAAVGLVTTGYMAYRSYFEAVDHVARANETYNAGLAQRLDVCVSGYYVVPCESAVAAPGSPPPPAPPPPAAQ